MCPANAQSWIYSPLLGIYDAFHSVKTRLRVRRFVNFPEDLYQLITDPQSLERYAEAGRLRKVSPYECPNCTALMLFVGKSEQDLICPRCFAVVNLLADADDVLYSPEPGTVLRRLPKSELRRLGERVKGVTFSPATSIAATQLDRE